MIKLEEWLTINLKENWKITEPIWNKYKESNINTIEFLKQAFKIIGEEPFYYMLDSFFIGGVGFLIY